MFVYLLFFNGSAVLSEALFDDDWKHTQRGYWICPPPAKERVEPEADKQDN